MDETVSPARLSELIGLIYDCALTPSCWPRAMEAIRIALNCELSSCNLHSLSSGETLINVTTNIDPHYVSIMEHSGADVFEQWGGEAVIRLLPLDRPAVLTRVNPAFDTATTTNRYYHEFAKPQGLIDVLTMGLARDDEALGTLSFGRHGRAGPFSDRDIEVAQLVLPHVQRAATINRLLDHLRRERGVLSDALDTLSTPVVLVDRHLAITYANAAAAGMLDRGQIAARDAGRLRVHPAAASSTLASAVRSFDDAYPNGGGAAQAVALLSSAGPVGSAYVLPVGQRMRGEGAAAAIFFADLQAEFRIPIQLVSSLFDLTPSEARVFALLATGRSLREAADALCVALSTVKTHMLRVYAKLGVSRRADLVRIASALSSPA